MLQAGEQMGGFRIERVLGEGGMGTVYLATQLSTGRQRALKVMLPTFAQNAQYVERFVTEARVGSQIQSEHVVEVVAAGVDDRTQTPWLAMELLEGQSLDEMLAQRGALPAPEVAQFFEQTCHGLGAAHRAGIVHRDLKPENLFIAKARRVGLPFVVKILDFGIAKLTQEAIKAQGSQAIGTPYWMAPEQTKVGALIGPATDIWALGLIAFYSLAGRPYWLSGQPDRPSSLPEFLSEMMTAPFEPPSSRVRQIGVSIALTPAFDAWFAKCLTRDVAHRFQNVDQCLDGLRVALSPATYAPTAAVGTMVLNSAALPSQQNWARHSPQPVQPNAPTALAPHSQPASQHGAYSTPAAGSFSAGTPHPSQSGQQPWSNASSHAGQGHPGAQSYPGASYPGAQSYPGSHPGSFPGQPSFPGSQPGHQPIQFAPEKGDRTLLYAGVGIAGALALGLVGAIVVGVAISGDEDNDDDDNVATGETGDDGYDDALAECQRAIIAQDPDLAVQRAGVALAARQNDAAAIGCRDQALGLQAERDTFQQGAAELQRGAYSESYATFERLPPASAFRSRPEIAQAVSQLAAQRIAQADGMIRSDAARAFLIARSVTYLRGVPASQMSQAQALVARARRSAGTVYEGQVVNAVGVSAPGGSCTVSVNRSRTPNFSCRIIVRCGGRTVYGANNSGFNHCARQSGQFVSASDNGRTRTDGDPEMRFNLGQRSLTVRDRGLDLTLNLLPDGPPPTPGAPVQPVPSQPRPRNPF